MSDKICATFDEAVRDIPDGATILIAGFGPGTPWNLMRALYFQGAKDLTLVCNSGAGGSAATAHEELKANLQFIEAGRVRKVIASFTASTHLSRKNALDEQMQQGTIEAELVPQGTLAERIRAGGAGIPAFYTPASVGTVLAEKKEHRVFKGREYVLEEAITADFAFLRCWKADLFGNLVFRRSQRNYNPLMAAAANVSIAEVEQPFVGIGDLDPDHIHTSGIYVKRMVSIADHPDAILHVLAGLPVSHGSDVVVDAAVPAGRA